MTWGLHPWTCRFSNWRHGQLLKCFSWPCEGSHGRRWRRWYQAVHVQMLAKQREGHIAFIRWMGQRNPAPVENGGKHPIILFGFHPSKDPRWCRISQPSTVMDPRGTMIVSILSHGHWICATPRIGNQEKLSKTSTRCRNASFWMDIRQWVSLGHYFRTGFDFSASFWRVCYNHL